MRRHEVGIERDDEFLAFCIGLGVLAIAEHLDRKLEELKGSLMAQADDLAAAVAGVQDSINSAITAINDLRANAGVDPAAVQAATDQLNAAKATLDAAVNPPAPEPAP